MYTCRQTSKEIPFFMSLSKFLIMTFSLSESLFFSQKFVQCDYLVFSSVSFGGLITPGRLILSLGVARSSCLGDGGMA